MKKCKILEKTGFLPISHPRAPSGTSGTVAAHIREEYPDVEVLTMKYHLLNSDEMNILAGGMEGCRALRRFVKDLTEKTTEEETNLYAEVLDVRGKIELRGWNGV